MIYLAILSYMVIFVTVSSYVIFNWQWGNLPFTCCVEIVFLCTRDRHAMRIIHCYWFEFYITADCSLSFGVRAVLSQCFCRNPTFPTSIASHLKHVSGEIHCDFINGTQIFFFFGSRQVLNVAGRNG